MSNDYRNSQGKRPSYSERFKNHNNNSYSQKSVQSYDKIKEETLDDILVDIERIIKEIMLEIDYIKRLRI